MKNKTPLTLDSVFKERSLFELLEKAKQIEALNQAISRFIPEKARPYCQVTNYKTDTLLIECVNATWSYFLKQRQHELIDRLKQKELPGLTQVDIKINPRLLTEASPPKELLPNDRILSDQTATLLEELAQNCEGALKESLLRLATLGKAKH